MIALSYHVLPPPGPFRVLGHHHKAINLLFDATGEIISLVAPEVGNGPGAIVVAGAVAPWLPPLSEARPWSPPLPPPPRRAAATQTDWPALVRELAGRGPGLTPEGDDFLCGMAVALRRVGHPGADPLAAAIWSLPPGTTTRLSHHFLKWAARGVAPEHHLTWVDAVLRGQVADPTRVLAHGATSGAAWIAGALAALRHHICEEEIHAPL